MGKTLNRDQRKNSKYLSRDNSRKLKEQLQYSNFNEEAPKPKPKKKWQPRSEIDVE